MNGRDFRIKDQFENVVRVEDVQKQLVLSSSGEVARKKILMNGHGFGSMNALSNIVTDSFAFDISGSVIDHRISPEGKQVFKDVRSL
ncbi:unnamed protein product [Ilex paraguariensis]|uniref:Uncharacterized protein n=1 Tax=Ilex paraguariensis TaxID=185542 RepID=A0ABC8RAS0_9AQUA